MSDTQYQDLTELPANGEAFDPNELETSDYSDFEITTPGRYVSPQRTITWKQKEDGNITFEIRFDGLLNEQGRKVIRPDRTWVSTKKFTRFNRPGQTSGVAQYLRALGFDMDAVKADGLQQTMAASSTLPVGVIVSLQDRSKEVPSGTDGARQSKNGKWYKSHGLKTKDFMDASGRFTPQVSINGDVFTAEPRANGFFRIK